MTQMLTKSGRGSISLETRKIYDKKKRKRRKRFIGLAIRKEVN